MEKLRLNQDIHSDPSINYEMIEGILTQLYATHFPVKTVRYNKYQRKKFSWIQQELINQLDIKTNYIGN